MPSKDESTRDTITKLMNDEPFVSFQIVMASGDRYRIEDPNVLAVAASQVHYYPPTGMGIHVRLNQVVSVEVERERPVA
jgi:hypothetical protein